MGIELRPYQRAAVDAAHVCGERDGATLLVAATGLGKTTMFSAYAAERFARTRKRVLVLAHREELVKQAAARIASQTGLDVGVEMADYRASHLLPQPVVVASVQTMGRESRLRNFDPASFGTVIIDECFVRGTMVGDVEIQDVRAGDMVPAYDERTGATRMSRVVAAWSSAPSSLVRVTSADGREWHCTPGHPFMTNRGWVPAAHLLASDMMLCTTHEHKLPRMQLSGHGVNPVREDASKNGRSYVLEGVHREAEESHCVRNDVSDEPKARKRTHESKQPHAQGGREGKNEDVTSGYGMEASEARGQRNRAYRTADATGECVGMGDGGCDTYGDCEGERISDLLQGGYREQGADGCRGGGRDVARAAVEARAGQKEGGASVWIGVEGVEVLEQTSDGTFGGVCPDGLVYNIEVEGLHTYDANGVVVHNCHHATSSTYRRIAEYFDGSVLLGVTATPDRTDKRGLGEVFRSVCFKYDIADGIADGWLVPIKQLSVFCDKLDLSRAKTSMGDLSEKDLQAAIGAEEVLHQIAGPLVKEAGERQTIVFCPGVQAARDLAGVMARYTSAPIGIVYGAMPAGERKATLDAFAAKQMRFIVNCAVLTEGYDAPDVSCVAVARPTKSRSLYTQMVGRGLRLAAGKTDCLVLDFHGNAGRHKLVCPADVLAGEPLDDKTRERVRAICEKGEEPTKAIERVKEEEIAEARRVAASKGVKAEAKYTATEVNPFSILGVRPVASDGPEMSEAQRHLLERAGIKTGNITSRDASRAIEAIIDRRKKGLCTMKQATLLARFGYSTNLTMEQASALIDRLSANGWRRVAV